MARNITDAKARAPQGAKRVARAFLDELGTIADDKQAAVAKAAQGMIHETLTARREKARAAKAKSKSTRKTSAPAGRAEGAAATTKRPWRATRKPAVQAPDGPAPQGEAPAEG